jgi:dUTP pyrophosphatase
VSGVTVELKVLDERVRAWGLPRYQSDMAAAVDLFACVDAPLTIAPQSAAQFVPAGIAIHIADPNIAAIIVPRSGLGHKKGLVLGNLVGVISVWNRSEPGSAPIVIEPGDRIAQLMFVPVVRPAFAVVDEFSALSLRGAGGFGSTGR